MHDTTYVITQEHNFASIDQTLQAILQQRAANGSLRHLRIVPSEYVDFSSNDYLGFARQQQLQCQIAELVSLYNKQTGATGSRLLSGNSSIFEEAEHQIANFHRADSALLFNSGYTANVGIFATLARRNDIIVYDELSHASTHDGIRLSPAKAYAFKHNDTTHLHELLQKVRQQSPTARIWVAIETVYSMEGDFAPLADIVALAKQYNAHLIADEAHALGVVGKNGEGLVGALGLEDSVYVRLYTYGKAMGCHGAAIVGTATLRQYLINFCRSFIYTTAMSWHSVAAISSSYDYLSKNPQLVADLQNKIAYFRRVATENIPTGCLLDSPSAIQGIIVGGNQQTRNLAQQLYIEGFDVRPILAPTVPITTERLRICLHTHNTYQQIDQLLSILKNKL